MRQIAVSNLVDSKDNLGEILSLLQQQPKARQNTQSHLRWYRITPKGDSSINWQNLSPVLGSVWLQTSGTEFREAVLENDASMGKEEYRKENKEGCTPFN